MNKIETTFDRVVGFDCHPDTFTAALVRGPTPAAASVEKTFNQVPLRQLENWAKKHTTDRDLFLLEASGNSFQVVRQLEAMGRSAKVLESFQLGKLKEAHANNDQISAIRIAKAYLAGTAKSVWIPDPKTQERRDWFHAHGKAVRSATRERNSLLSYLSDNGVRLKRGTRLTQPSGEEAVRQSRDWSARQWQVIAGRFMTLRHAEEQRRHWRSLIAQEVAADPELLRLTRLCGIRDVIAFALGALIGDIRRFARPGSLVKYVGLNPAFDDSGAGQWRGGIGGHGRKDLRGLLMEAAQALLRSRDPIAAWGKKLLARKSSHHLAVAALARKLTVAVWYWLMGKATPLEEIDERQNLKLGKIISQIGAASLKQLGQTRRSLREQMHQILKTGKVYVLQPCPATSRPPQSTSPPTLAPEHGLA